MISQKHFNAVFLATFFFSACPAKCSGKDGTEVSKSVVFSATADITSAGGIPRATVELGSYRPGSELSGKIEIRNSSDRILEFSQIQAGCSCLSVDPQVGDLSIDEVKSFNVKIAVPNAPSRLDYSVPFTARRNGRPQFLVTMKYSLNGVVGFSAPAIRFKLPKGRKEHRISLSFFADALSTEGLVDIRKSEGMESLEMEVEFSKKRIWLVIAESTLTEKRLLGTLDIENIETGSRDSMFLDISLESAIAVYPKTLKFNFDSEHADEDDASRWKAIAMVVDKNRETDPEARTTAASFHLDGKILRSRVSRDRGQVTIYDVFLGETVLESLKEQENQDKHVVCKVVGLNESVSLKVPFSVSNANSLKEMKDD